MPTLVNETDLAPNLRSLVKRAENALKTTPEYAVQLMLPVVKQVPGYLEGRQLLRRAAVLNAKANGSRGGGLGGGIAVVKLQSRAKKESAETLLPEIEDILAADPYNAQANSLLHELALSLNMQELAIFALQTIREGHPSDTKNLHRLAEYYVGRDEPMKAADIYQAILDVDPTDAFARKGVTNTNARASIKNQGWNEQQNLKSLLANQKEVRQLEADAKVGNTRQQLEQRLADLSQQYSTDQSNPNIVRRIAETYELLEDLPNAIQWFQYAFSLSHADVSLESRVLQLTSRLEDQQLTQLKSYLDANPNAPDAAETAAQYEALKLSKAERQVTAAKERVERNPSDPMLRFELGQALFSAGHLSEAIPELQRAKANPHIKSKAMLMLSRCFESKNMLDMAVKQLQEVNQELLAMDALKKEVLYALGLLNEKLGRKDEYLACLKQIYEVDYEYEDVAPRVEASYGG